MAHNDKAKYTHTNDRPGMGMSEKTADFIARKNQESTLKSAQLHYPLKDKGKEAREIHTNGSTPKRDQ